MGNVKITTEKICDGVVLLSCFSLAQENGEKLHTFAKTMRIS